MKWAVVNASDGIVVNIIEYNGVSPFNPGEGLSLMKVNLWVNIGDHKDTPAP